MDPKMIEMAALGRALYPGMLYDCHSDSFIPEGKSVLTLSSQVCCTSEDWDDDDVAFRFNPHLTVLCTVVCDSFINEQWEIKEETAHSPLIGGGAFDILMLLIQKNTSVTLLTRF
ncbi:hypothetical protein NFI96_017378 [Prochilodus magdalenae]|nr:hypothetical protein NFI96_017378 [Prochilodus magdalenae]